MANILLYDAQTGSKLFSLAHLFNQVLLPGTGLTLQRVTQDDVLQQMNPDTDLLILPGARAGTPYRQQFSGAQLEQFKESVAGGMQVLGICAGAYVLAQNFAFMAGTPADKVIEDNPLGLAPVWAHGPDPALCPLNKPDFDNPWSVYAAVLVDYSKHIPSRFGVGPRQAFLALSQGPSFEALEGAAITPLAHYRQTGDAAIVQFAYGKGGGVLSGPALEVGGANLMQYVHPRHRADPACNQIIEALEGSAKGWAHLWANLATRLLPRQPQAHAIIRHNLGL
jgi:glutamine amidotransferase-like uncharacterized protein